MMRWGDLRRPRWMIFAIGLLLIAGALALVLHREQPLHGIPYRDSFAQGKADEWQALGGTWELMGGSMRNDSDERGAKLLTGSSLWKDYSIEADVMLLGIGGDAGLLLRTSDEEQGVDAYTGYYAGLRTLDNSLVIGRAGHGWVETSESLGDHPPGVQVSQWYHLKLLAYGCRLVASVVPLPAPSQRPTMIAVKDDDCLPSGRAGLRSYASGGVWRNVQVRAARQSDLVERLTVKGTPPTDQFQAKSEGPGPWDLYAPGATPAPKLLHSSNDAQLVRSLRLASPTQLLPVTVRGTVVLANPAIYVQDASGGANVRLATAQPLKVGDEVEVTGRVRRNAFSPVLEAATVRVLWENTPMPPVSVTASQAATGAFDATFIEVEGRLTAKTRSPNDNLIFQLDSGPQSFRAVMNRGRADTLFNTVKLGSVLRLRGVAVSDAAYTQNLVPFTMLLRSSDDAVILAGPPWWNPRHELGIAGALLALAMLTNLLYHRVEKWRWRAVLEERERMAYEMHDTLSQSFAGIGFQLKAIREGMPEEQLKLRQQLDMASELVRHSHQETRRSIAALQLNQTGADDLLASLRECAMHLVEGGSVELVTGYTGDMTKPSLRLAETMYHIGQEALANAVRHGQPTKLEIQLASDKAAIRLLIRDNGSGFQLGDDLPGFGLRGMRKRAAFIGALLQIESRIGQGTEVSVRASLREPRLGAQTMLLSKDFWRRLGYGGGSERLD